MGKVVEFPADRTAKGAHGYFPEMGDRKPNCQIEAMLVGSHYYLKTPLKLQGRGIKHQRTLTPADLVKEAQHKVGWHEYQATYKAYSKLKKDYSISSRLLLD